MHGEQGGGVAQGGGHLAKDRHLGMPMNKLAGCRLAGRGKAFAASCRSGRSAFRNVDAGISRGQSHCPLLDIKGRHFGAIFATVQVILAAVQMSPMLLKRIVCTRIELCPTCSSHYTRSWTDNDGRACG